MMKADILQKIYCLAFSCLFACFEFSVSFDLFEAFSLLVSRTANQLQCECSTIETFRNTRKTKKANIFRTQTYFIKMNPVLIAKMSLFQRLPGFLKVIAQPNESLGKIKSVFVLLFKNGLFLYSLCLAELAVGPKKRIMSYVLNLNAEWFI